MTHTERRILRIGTRSSLLALEQTRLVTEALAVEHELVPIQTEGDRNRGAERGEGIFVKEIQRHLLAGDIDLAVHSLKDIPTEPTEGIRLAAILEREDPREFLVGATIDSLKSNARVGTGSPRRSAQLKSLRHDVEVVPIRGNVPTRLDKVERGEVDAAVLAIAGLLRLGLQPDGQVFDASEFLPAPGQGAIAVEARSDDAFALAVCSEIDHLETRMSVTAERIVLRELGGGCMLPVATLAAMQDGVIRIEGRVVSSDGKRSAHTIQSGRSEDFESIAKTAAGELRSRGAMELLQ